MIISHKHKFIFIKPAKVAGTSVLQALGSITGPDDICGGINKVVERTGIVVETQNYSKNLDYPPLVEITDEVIKVADKKSARYRLWKLCRSLHKRHLLPPGVWRSVNHGFGPYTNGRVVVNHLKPQYIRRVVGEDIWNNYTKVTIVRNPWDRLVSEVCWLKGTKRLNYEKSMTELARRTVHLEWLLWPDGTPVADFYIRYEHLSEDFSRFCKSINLEEVPELPNLRSSDRDKSIPYQAYYENEQEAKEIIADVWRPIIDMFGYTFG